MGLHRIMTLPENLFAEALASTPDLPKLAEEFHVLHESSQVRIERIVSHSQASPPEFWYDQEDDEWVLLVRGEAVLEFEGGEEMRLQTGSYLLIPRHQKHRVQSTSKDAVWLAVHLKR